MTLLFLEASHLYLDAKSTIDIFSIVDAHFVVKELTEWFASRAVGPRRRRAQWPVYRRWLPKLSTPNRQKFVAWDSHATTREIRLRHRRFRDVDGVESIAFCEQAQKLFLHRVMINVVFRC